MAKNFHETSPPINTFRAAATPLAVGPRSNRLTRYDFPAWPAMGIQITSWRMAPAAGRKMNIHPTLTSHPKFLIFKQDLKLIGVPDALEYLLRIWSHCQTKQLGENWGKVGPEYLEAICNWTGEPGKLFDLLVKEFCGKKGWIHRKKSGELIVTSWNEHNKSLLNSWESGRLSKGRPRTLGKPTENPRVMPQKTLGKPTENPIGGERRGEDLIREEGTGGDGTGSPTPSLAPTLAQALAYCKRQGMDYTPEEITAVFRTFEGTKNIELGQWYWGRKLVTDWRAVFEQRLADNRHQKPQETKSAIADEISKKTRKINLQSVIENHIANAESGCFDENCSPEKRRELTQLRRELDQLTRELGGGGK